MTTLASQWFEISYYAGLGFVALAILFFVFYHLQLQMITDRSKKYAHAAQKEIGALRRTSTSFAFAVFFFAFNIVAGWLGLAQGYQYIFVAFISFMISFIIGYGFSAYLTYYYPFVLEKRLKGIRFKGFRSAKGNKMRLLNELEEDEHMTEEMRQQEDNMEADFDVWIDEATGEKIIHKYDITEHALICPRCNFRTLKERGEEVINEPTEHDDGTMERTYKCTYCGHNEIKEIRILNWAEKRRLEEV